MALRRQRFAQGDALGLQPQLGLLAMGVNGEGHSCDPALCFYWLHPLMEHPASMMLGADWGEEHGRVEKKLGEM